MTKVSASTLARQAAKTKNPKEAKRLRAQAAKMRRDARKPRPADKIMKGLNEVLANVEQSRGAALGAVASVDHAPLVSKPWYETEDSIGRLMKAAKNPVEFRDQLSMLLSGSRYDGRAKAINEHTDALKSQNEAWAVATVSAFLARCEGEERAGPLPKFMVVDGCTVARVVDALRTAGYTTDGKTGAPRWRAVGR